MNLPTLPLLVKLLHQDKWGDAETNGALKGTSFMENLGLNEFQPAFAAGSKVR